MKKVVTVALVLFLMAALYSSCKSHGTCPAYGKVEHNKQLPA